MFYLFSSISNLITAFTAIALGSILFFCLAPYVTCLKTQLNLMDPWGPSTDASGSRRGSLGSNLRAVHDVGRSLKNLIDRDWVLNNSLLNELTIVDGDNDLFLGSGGSNAWDLGRRRGGDFMNLLGRGWGRGWQKKRGELKAC
ncbi:uncharacterized protein A4U43_C04F29830 [Asparagus officinalis]|uniref:Uncharacterized protein n=1 Tax=Asparagus officinalis TaxID=4686 RepID=A0A5P1F9L7_ASPOF|nr:uncharacterized protein A4U43_C04F29830 [Asparagus officinalis]